jgi:ElaB/YqjD/DUF883 family membrane-anchored ribosome-binding protein
MPDEPEVIQQQMEQTRAALAEKLETLEQHVTGTVSDVTNTVSAATNAVSETVETVKDAVGETVESVKESVKTTFDLAGHVDRHPWLLMGGAVAAGYFGGRLLNTASAHHGYEGHVGRSASQPMGPASPGPTAGSSAGRYYAEPAHPASPGWLSILTNRFGREIGQLKSLAVGAAIGVVRDAVVNAAPEPLRPQLKDVINDITEKLGGKAFAEPVLSTNGHHGRV